MRVQSNSLRLTRTSSRLSSLANNARDLYITRAVITFILYTQEENTRIFQFIVRLVEQDEIVYEAEQLCLRYETVEIEKRKRTKQRRRSAREEKFHACVSFDPSKRHRR